MKIIFRKYLHWKQGFTLACRTEQGASPAEIKKDKNEKEQADDDVPLLPPALYRNAGLHHGAMEKARSENIVLPVFPGND